MSIKNVQKPSKEESVITKFWGTETTKFGWTAIPNTLLMLQSDLKISSTEMCILFNILMHQWPESGVSLSFPSIGTIASRMGTSKRTIQRGISNLESLGLLLRYPSTRNDPLTNGANIFDSERLKLTLTEKSQYISLNKKTRGKQKAESNNEVKLPHICHNCKKTKAQSKDEAIKLFGMRKTIAGDIIHSYCKSCREESINLDGKYK